MKLDILINRLHVLPVSNAGLTANSKLPFLSELANLGYRVKNTKLYNDSVLSNYQEIISTLKEMKGGDVDYVPLFSGFPNDIPEQNEYMFKRILGYVGNWFDIWDGEQMDDGYTVPNTLFDISKFGANPITQNQDKDLYEKGKQNQDNRMSDANVMWFDLSFVTTGDAINLAKKWLLDNLYSKSSIKQVLIDDLTFLMNYFGSKVVDINKIIMKENMTFVMKYLWNKKDYKTLSKTIKTSTDILRLFATLTDTDISLGGKIKFPKMNRPQRKFILSCLETDKNLAVNLKQYKDLWLEVGRYIHPFEYKKQFPKTNDAFDLLRNDIKKIETVYSKIEKMIKSDSRYLIPFLMKYPTIFSKYLHQLLVKHENYNSDILNGFEQVVNKIPLKQLLILEKYFKNINVVEYRTIINKHGAIKVIENKYVDMLTQQTIDEIVAIITNGVQEKIITDFDTLEDTKVWVDSKLSNYTVPLHQRKMSDGLLNLSRGSKMDLTIDKVFRMFVYWKEKSYTTDLDLSVVGFDDNMDFLGQVSFTNLKDTFAVHSGDLQSAPHGATEFIDIDIPMLKKKFPQYRYIAPALLKYAGENFNQVETCYSGWMLRNELNDKYKSFDIKTVENKINISGSNSYSLPYLLDLNENKLIYIDLYVGKSNDYITIEKNKEEISTICKQMVGFIDTKPNMLDLVRYHIQSRNAFVVANKEGADITFGLDDCDYSVDKPEIILSGLL